MEDRASVVVLTASMVIAKVADIKKIGALSRLGVPLWPTSRSISTAGPFPA